MSTAYQCQNDQRRKEVAEVTIGSQFRLNGIDYLEVNPDNQRELRLHFLHRLADVAGYSSLTQDSFSISGGTRIRGVRVIDPVIIHSQTVTLTVDQPGDFTNYRLRIVESTTSDKPPVWLDPLLSEIEFCFKINCPTGFDCRPSDVTAPLKMEEPAIDYMAKDYESFRRLMLDRMGFLLPAWKERNPADLAVALVELLAYVGDHLSYKQDSAAAEAYLGTAHRRVSLRRHARLMDYPVFDGANARVWVQIAVSKGGDGIVVPGPDEATNRPGTALLTRIDPRAAVLTLADAKIENALKNGARFFETMHALTLYEAHNEMLFYAWGNEGCRLPRGATAACLCDNVEDRRLLLRAGDVLIFEETRSPETGRADDADPARRHAVRLTHVHPQAEVDETGARTPGTMMTDPLFPDQALVDVRWHEEDALPFDLCIHNVSDPDNPGQDYPVCVALGNMVLADHGQTVSEAITVTDEKRFRPFLTHSPLTGRGHVRLTAKNGRLEPFDPEGSAASAMNWPRELVSPAIHLVEKDHSDLVWQARRDLLAGDVFTRDFVAEIEEDGHACLRFGDGVTGQRPDAGRIVNAHYRVGNGSAGNVGAETLSHLILRADGTAAVDPSRIKAIRNPLCAQGGQDAETNEQIRKYAPHAFQTQERAVNAADYARIAMRHPDIQQAAATVRWTGSWPTVYVTIDRKGGRAVDDTFIADMKAYLDCYRMAGYDVEVNGPLFIPLDIACDVYVKPGYFQMDVHRALLNVFSSRELPNGGRGFFHPDQFTFGQALYLSRFYAAAMAVAGVAFVEVKTFQRLGKKAAGELAAARLCVSRLEVIRLDNDPSFPENGKIEFNMRDTHV